MVAIFVSYFSLSQNPDIVKIILEATGKRIQPEVIEMTDEENSFVEPNLPVQNNQTFLSDQETKGSMTTYIFGEDVPESPSVDNAYFQNVLFIGDSLTQGIKSYGYLPYNNVLAKTGLTLQSALDDSLFESEDGNRTLVEAIGGYSATKIYMMLGTNNIAQMTPEQLIDKYTALVQEIKNEYPKMTIVIQAILPVTEAFETKNATHTNEKIDKVNLLLREMCKQEELYYINVSMVYKDDSGALCYAFSPNDGLHISKNAYTLWIDYLKTHTVS